MKGDDKRAGKDLGQRRDIARDGLCLIGDDYGVAEVRSQGESHLTSPTEIKMRFSGEEGERACCPSPTT